MIWLGEDKIKYDVVSDKFANKYPTKSKKIIILRNKNQGSKRHTTSPCSCFFNYDYYIKFKNVDQWFWCW